VNRKAWHATAAAVLQARERFAGKGPLVGFAGRLVYEKGVQDLVDAVPQMKAQHPGLKVVIAGDGPYKDELQSAVRRRGVTSTVAFTGFLTELELPALLGATAATVVPSLYEPFGMVALEAASAGAPLAVASTGGLAEIVEPGVTGMTFPHSDPPALADAVGTLLAEPVKAREMTKRATAMIAERYGWQGIASRVAIAYASASLEPQAVPEIAIPDGNLLR
jgi:glycogen(starch) synthase